MERFFNTNGPCREQRHYMLPAERRITDLRRLVDQALYFVVHAPRQVGKTTSLGSLAESLTAEGRYAALLTSCEAAQKLRQDFEGSMAVILDELHTMVFERRRTARHTGSAPGFSRSCRESPTAVDRSTASTLWGEDAWTC